MLYISHIPRLEHKGMPKHQAQCWLNGKLFTCILEKLQDTAELPTISDSFLLFTGYANATSTPIWVEVGGGGGGWRWWEAMKWQVNPPCKMKTAKWHRLELFSAPHNTKQLIHAQPHHPIMSLGRA